MSVTLATVADALIEFILSLLRDPETAAEFEDDPDAALASRGLRDVSAADVCAVAPVVIDRVHVVPAHTAPPAAPRTTIYEGDDGSDSVTRVTNVSPVVREISNITNNFAWLDDRDTMVDDRDTIVDQSVNQNIWADGDVSQVFDQGSVVASGDDAIAAGAGVDIEQTEDNSTNITAGNDANIGNDTTTTANDGSFNEATDSSTTTDNSTTTTTTGSANDNSTTATADGSFNGSTITTTNEAADAAAVQTVPAGDEAAPVTDAPLADEPVAEAPATEAPVAEAPVAEVVDAPAYEEPPAAEPVAPEPEDVYSDSAAEYVEAGADDDAAAFESSDTLIVEDAPTDGEF